MNEADAPMMRPAAMSFTFDGGRAATPSAARVLPVFERARAAMLALLAVTASIAGCTEPSTVPPVQDSAMGASVGTDGPEMDAPAMDASTGKVSRADTGAMEDGCSPSCKDRECGDDGCGGRCGVCEESTACRESTGRCVDCVGEDCACVPDCNRRSCGSDGCGGSCGECEDDEMCAPEGRCRTPRCGNDIIEGDEQCDGNGDPFCNPDCTRMSVEQSTCRFGDSNATDACRDCACEHCTEEVLNCYISGDAPRDAACKTIAECAADNNCSGFDCFCGPGQCRPPNGPCLSELQTALGVGEIGIFEIQRCLEDPDCALYRANAFGTCSYDNCSDECGFGMRVGPRPPDADMGAAGSGP
jgi:hypothetical protein